jgi:protein arginine kinase activator
MEISGVKCQSCSNEATVHLTSIIDGQKTEKHLCSVCAEQQHAIQHQELNLPAILHNLIGQHVGQLTDELARLTCPACGMGYMEFRAEGRLGCPHDYSVFRAGLEPLLQRIHRSERHVGKTPRHRARHARQEADLLALRQGLKHAIEEEAYEEAARLRDLLRIKEASDESGQPESY